MSLLFYSIPASSNHRRDTDCYLWYSISSQQGNPLMFVNILTLQSFFLKMLYILKCYKHI